MAQKNDTDHEKQSPGSNSSAVEMKDDYLNADSSNRTTDSRSVTFDSEESEPVETDAFTLEINAAGAMCSRPALAEADAAGEMPDDLLSNDPEPGEKTPETSVPQKSKATTFRSISRQITKFLSLKQHYRKKIYFMICLILVMASVMVFMGIKLIKNHTKIQRLAYQLSNEQTYLECIEDQVNSFDNGSMAQGIYSQCPKAWGALDGSCKSSCMSDCSQ